MRDKFALHPFWPVCSDTDLITCASTIDLTKSLREQVCTKLDRGGPNNATYVTGFTILDREHTAVVGIEDIGTQLSGVGPPMPVTPLSCKANLLDDLHCLHCIKVQRLSVQTAPMHVPDC